MDPLATKDELFHLSGPAFSRQAEEIAAIRLAAIRARDAAIAEGLRRAARGLRSWVAVLAETLATWPARRRIYDDLNALTDRELADIGLNRGDIAHVFDPDFEAPRREAANGQAAAPALAKAA